MSDVEERLGTALAAIADAAPRGAGLADAARSRYRRRRQRRVVAAGVAAVLVVVAGGLLLARPEPREGHVTTPSRAGDWQTIRQGEAVAEVPGDWRRSECAGRIVYAPSDPCTDWKGAGFSGAANYDPAMGPGVILRFPADDDEWTGYVYVGQQVLSVSDPDRDLVRRVLASARLDGQPVVDGSRWVPRSGGVVSYEIPVGWGLPQGDRSGYSACVALARGTPVSEQQVDVRTYRSTQHFDAFAVTVTAPTRAVADLVLGTVAVHPEVSRMDRCTGEDAGLVPVEADGVKLEIPRDWDAHSCGDLPQFGPGTTCRASSEAEGVQFLYAATYQPAMDEGEVVRNGALWGGYVRRGEYAVLVTARDRALVTRLLERVG
ncbi:hypothetical protein [Nocardioides daeguensis]|uniref:Uncharacterized protein n=1 Tax=Nocardioides daeguensis TaxID=908359 RepID=A0ABP6W2C3_9ACTN|nr:hypothetical protein [Nocardioides daeguensis]MBV6727628.1 hypothetical protein [Nocardioides daeguensis]MCR1775100.1 hypothetical protein [Nocardioides daeguensis]